MSENNLKKLPKTLTKEIFVTLAVGGWNAGSIQCRDFDISDNDDYIPLTTKEVTFKLPENIDIKGKVIESLEAAKDKIQAETHMRVKDIQDKIDNLLAIEYKP